MNTMLGALHRFLFNRTGFAVRLKPTRSAGSVLLASLVALSLLLGKSHWADTTTPPRLSAGQERAALAEAQERGQALFRHDRAAWIGTDALSAHTQGRMDDRVRGYLTEEHDDQLILTFHDGAAAALFRVRMRSADFQLIQLDVLEPPQPLSDYEAAALRARQAPSLDGLGWCAARYNTVVLPAPGPKLDAWWVYFMPGTTQADSVPVGGFYRFEVRKGRVVGKRAFTKTCLNLQKPANAAGLFVTHLMDPVPTEVHVFTSLWAGAPLFVGTAPENTVWKVQGGTVERLQR